MGTIKKFPVKRKSLEPAEVQAPSKKKARFVWRKPLRTLVAAFIIVNIFVGGYVAVNQQLQLRALEEDIGSFLATKEKLMEEKEHLLRNLDEVEDEKMVEKIAREQLGLIRPGEKLLIIK